MSGTGRPEINDLAGAGLKLGIVATRWNAEVVDTMLQRALEAATSSKIDNVIVERVSGSIELPVVVQELARQCDAVVALGVVVRGGTPHFEYVCDSVTQGLTRIALDESTPVGNGVLTCDTQEQAIDRSGAPGSTEDKGWDATLAAIDAALTLKRLRSN